MQYFKLAMAGENRWTLAIEREDSSGTPIDIWAYSMAKEAVSDLVPFCIDVEGKMVDFNPTAFGTIVVSSRMATILERFVSTEIQWIPAIVKGLGNDWKVMNTIAVVDCINHELSKIQYFPDDHPEKPGKPRGVMKMVLDSDRANEFHVFKPKDWLVSTIVSAEVKRALEDAGITGVEFWPVTEDAVV